MKRASLIVLSCVVACVTAVPVLAAERCKVRVNPRDGTISVSAVNVVGTLTWGPVLGEETEAFPDAATCIVAAVARNCALGAAGTPARITPPPLCTLYVADSASDDCSVYIRGCVPGAREGFAPSSCTMVQGAATLINSWYVEDTVLCPAGTEIMSGGYERWAWDSTRQCIPVENRPKEDGTGWTVIFAAPNQTECAGNSFRVWAKCCPQ
ncbi:MAG: hypothetical protein HY899_10905 [Deltaproteobacteria bacterium]|nr:hypothetical protein [Deltaproteobacteria bacterium]